ncbi:hypothetical protein IH992_01225, partial [Candidatus Poribacteria bacterium]|nr:hypothetical protein [Candidatus Poribacteria bacterium]
MADLWCDSTESIDNQSLLEVGLGFGGEGFFTVLTGLGAGGGSVGFSALRGVTFGRVTWVMSMVGLKRGQLTWLKPNLHHNQYDDAV